MIIDGNGFYSSAYLLDWQHVDFKLKIEESFEFLPLIDFPSNGDYVFLVLNDVSNVIFGDGINECLYFYGESLVQEVCSKSRLASYITQQ